MAPGDERTEARGKAMVLRKTAELAARLLGYCWDHMSREMLVPDEHLSRSIAVPRERGYGGT
jgi:hypothetical protein